MFPHKILKPRGLELLFPAFSRSYLWFTHTSRELFSKTFILLGWTFPVIVAISRKYVICVSWWNQVACYNFDTGMAKYSIKTFNVVQPPMGIKLPVPRLKGPVPDYVGLTRIGFTQDKRDFCLVFSGFWENIVDLRSCSKEQTTRERTDRNQKMRRDRGI